MQSDLETHAKDLWRKLHKMQSELHHLGRVQIKLRCPHQPKATLHSKSVETVRLVTPFLALLAT